ncbi:Bug family tripartite tricarboxylate transporter substrate binding protein [Pseudochelatococcus sp. B33]
MTLLKIVAAAGVVATLVANGSALAQEYPSRPITFVVPFAPGGGNDTLARVVTAQAAKELNGVFVVENRPGAGGGVAAQLVGEASADGYMVLQGNVAHAINMSFYKNPGYDFVKDFTPVTLMATTALLICVNPKVQASTLQELIDLAKANPGRLTYGSSGIGGSSHLAVELFKTKAGVDILHIPYQGAAPSITDMIAGRLDIALPTPSNAKPLMDAGQMRCLASTGAKRSASMPDMPTVAEAANIPDYEAAPWYGVVTKAGTPVEVIEKLADAFKKALADPSVQAMLNQQGFEIASNSPAEFGEYIESEVAKWGEVVKTSGATAD